jgi:hypothetical protein
MLRRQNNILLIALSIVLLVTIGLMLQPAFAGNSGNAGTPRRVDILALGEEEVKQLLLLMDTNQNGKISKEEFTKFVAAEFDRLDTDKSGQLDPKELTQSQLRASHFSHAGK